MHLGPCSLKLRQSGRSPGPRSLLYRCDLFSQHPRRGTRNAPRRPRPETMRASRRCRAGRGGGHGHWHAPRPGDNLEDPVWWSVCVFITAVPITKLFAWGEGDSGGQVLRETTSRGLCGLVCPSRRLCERRRGEGGERERERALGLLLCHSHRH